MLFLGITLMNGCILSLWGLYNLSCFCPFVSKAEINGSNILVILIHGFILAALIIKHINTGNDPFQCDFKTDIDWCLF